MTDAARPRATPLIAWGLGLVALSVGLGAGVYAHGNGPFDIDAAWNVLTGGWDHQILLGFSLFMAFVGGGWFAFVAVPIAGTAVLLALRRPWAALYFVAAQALSVGLVQLLKQTFGRARPEDIILLADFGSYPSGHVAMAATLATALIVIFRRRWLLAVGIAWVLLMAFSRTHLHAHWLSDTVGGALVGAGAALVVAGALSGLLARERRRRATPSLG